MKHKHSKRNRMISLLLAAVLLLGDLPLGALAQEAAEAMLST